jgi:hypothetical protein
MKYTEKVGDVTSVVYENERQQTRQYPNRKEAMKAQYGSTDIELFLL